MKITDAKVLVCCPGRNFVTLKISTDESVNNFGIQEYMRHTSQTDEVFPHGYYFKAGYLHPGAASGLGLDYNEKLAESCPYARAYLPLNRPSHATSFNSSFNSPDLLLMLPPP